MTFDVRPSRCGAGLPNSQTVFRADILRHGESRHGVCPNHLVYDQAVRGNDWHQDRCRGAGTPRPSDGKHQMHRLRPGAFNQDRLFETKCGTLRFDRVNALPTPSTTTARRALRSCGASGRGIRSMTRLWRTVEYCETHWRLRLGGPAHRFLGIIAAEGPAKLGEEVELSSATFAALPPSWQG
jgi:hypothetical protein